ncbi:MAG: hypothetical protein BWY95_02599 [Bacteroidetes bacterium ADurb.BinA104]|nr:MAG: hypothetical protein BWY95_02599 [Bacteroidetes bacterium ADurb.BinA104]
MVGKRLSEVTGCLGVTVVIIVAPCLIHLVNAPGRTAILNPAARPFGHALIVEADNGVVFTHIGFTRHAYGIRLGETVAIGDNRLQSLYCFIDDAITLGIQLIKKCFVLLVFGDNVRTLHHHDAVINPFAIIAPKLGESVHAKPEQTVIGKLKGLLSFELGIQAIAACYFLKGFQFIYREKTHI